MKVTAQYMFAAFSTIAFCVAIGTFMYWLFFDGNPPVTPVSVRLMNTAGRETSVFRAGEQMLIRRENCASREALVFITRQVISTASAQAYVMPSGPYTVEKGCRTTVNLITLPPVLPPGTYEYAVTMTYSNNPLVQGTVRLQTFRFSVE